MAKSKSSRHSTKYQAGGRIGEEFIGYPRNPTGLIGSEFRDKLSHEAGPSNNVPSPGREQTHRGSIKNYKSGGKVTGG